MALNESLKILQHCFIYCLWMCYEYPKAWNRSTDYQNAHLWYCHALSLARCVKHRETQWFAPLSPHPCEREETPPLPRPLSEHSLLLDLWCSSQDGTLALSLDRTEDINVVTLCLLEEPDIVRTSFSFQTLLMIKHSVTCFICINGIFFFSLLRSFVNDSWSRWVQQSVPLRTLWNITDGGTHGVLILQQREIQST